MSEVIKLNNGVGYYNIDNSDNKENRENIANISSSWISGKAAATNLETQGEAKPDSSVGIQAATPQDPNLNNTLRVISQIFYNTNSTQKHKIKVKMHHTDQDPTEWIASMNTDPRVFRKYNNIELAREWIAGVREQFNMEKGFKKPYLGKFHLVADKHGKTGGTQKEKGCYAAMAYNKEDQSWYAMIKIFDFVRLFEYDYNFTNTQQAQGVKAQIVWNNPQLQKHKRPLTYRERKLMGK